MAAVFDKIRGDDEIFSTPEYVADSVIFNAIESARNDEAYNIFSDHKNVIISTCPSGHRVWIWTSSGVGKDTQKLIAVCRFISNLKIPKVELYVKQEVSGNLSDLYSLASTEIDYVVKDEFSLAVFTYDGGKIDITGDLSLAENEKIIRIDRKDPEQVKLVRDFYTACCDEFRWHDKFDRKVEEYLDMELYGLIRDGKMIANAAIGSPTEKYLRLKSIAVLKDERKKGYGSKMCAFAVNVIKDDDRIPMLYTHVGNRSAMALWAKTGFRMYDKLYLLKVEDNG